MTSVEVEEARTALAGLEGRSFGGIGRAATLVWLVFGGEVPWVDYRGERTVRPELALHLQCQWRLLRDGEVLVEQRDLLVPGVRGGNGFEAGGDIGSARFDDRVETVAVLIAAEIPTVVSVSLDDRFGLRLRASSGLMLEASPAEREGWEDWRFISSAGRRRHYIVENGSMSAA